MYSLCQPLAMAISCRVEVTSNSKLKRSFCQYHSFLPFSSLLRGRCRFFCTCAGVKGLQSDSSESFSSSQILFRTFDKDFWSSVRRFRNKDITLKERYQTRNGFKQKTPHKRGFLCWLNSTILERYPQRNQEVYRAWSPIGCCIKLRFAHIRSGTTKGLEREL